MGGGKGAVALGKKKSEGFRRLHIWDPCRRKGRPYRPWQVRIRELMTAPSPYPRLGSRWNYSTRKGKGNRYQKGTRVDIALGKKHGWGRGGEARETYFRNKAHAKGSNRDDTLAGEEGKLVQDRERGGCQAS